MVQDVDGPHRRVARPGLARTPRSGWSSRAAGHTDPVEVLRDAGRYTRLVARGWRIYRYTRYDVYGDPGRIITELTHALGRS